jgi:starvation-inducible DNA-binding protein
MEQLLERLKILLATNFSFYLKLHFFHWNVTGPNFPQYHEFFEKLYTDVWGATDDIAEHIRAVKGFAPGSLSRFMDQTQIKDQLDVVPAEQMLSIAIQDNDKVIDVLTQAYLSAEQNAEHGLANFLQDRIDIHKKHGWMLRATLS